MVEAINNVQLLNIRTIDYDKIQEAESKSSENESSSEFGFAKKLVNVLNTFKTESSEKIKTIGHATGELIASCFSNAISGVSNIYDGLRGYAFNTAYNAEPTFYTENENFYESYKEGNLYAEIVSYKITEKTSKLYFMKKFEPRVNILNKDVFKSFSPPELHNLSTLDESRITMPEKNSFKSYNLPLLDKKFHYEADIALGMMFSVEANQLLDSLKENYDVEKPKLQTTEL